MVLKKNMKYRDVLRQLLGTGTMVFGVSFFLCNTGTIVHASNTSQNSSVEKAVSESRVSIERETNETDVDNESSPTDSSIVQKQKDKLDSNNNENNSTAESTSIDQDNEKVKEDSPSYNSNSQPSSTSSSLVQNDSSSTDFSNTDSNDSVDTSEKIDIDNSENNNKKLDDNETELTAQSNDSLDTKKDDSSISDEIKSLLRTEPDRFSIGDTRYTSADAVDVSSYQNWMTQADFNYLKKIGIKTVIVKLTEGSTYLNPYAQQQMKFARNAGLNVSVYHFVRFNTQGGGNREGQYLANKMKNLGLGTGTLIFADIESEETQESNINMQNALQAFWNTLNHYGYTNHGVYVGPGYKYLTQVVATVGKSRTWLAQYPYTPSKGGSFEKQWQAAGYGGWQFSSQAILRGNFLDVSHAFNNLLIDTFSQKGNVEQVNVGNEGIYVRGWHIRNQDNDPYAYIIAWDSKNKKEIGRVAYTPQNREDVARKYTGIPGALKSGFNVWIPIRKGYNISGQNIQFILRYSADRNGDLAYEQMTSKNFEFQNRGHLDSISLDKNNILNVRGWQASDDSYRLNNSFVIIYDTDRRKEIARVSYIPQLRSDVAKSSYAGGIANSLYSGFDLNIDLKKYNIAGRNIQVVMRKSIDGNNHDSQFVDIWSAPHEFSNQNKGHLDNIELGPNNILHVRGWHAADSSRALKYAMLIVYDASSNHEIKRINYTPLLRRDVADSAYAGKVFDSLHSGYDLNIDLGNYFVYGKDLQIVMRYSADSDAADTQFVDVWSSSFHINNRNKAVLEQLNLELGNGVHVRGWHVADASALLKNAMIIIYDTTSKHEITRVNYVPQQRKDVLKSSYAGKIGDSLNSGFDMDIDLKNYPITGKKIQVIMRYSVDQDNKDSKFIDIWSKPVILKKV